MNHGESKLDYALYRVRSHVVPFSLPSGSLHAVEGKLLAFELTV